MRGHPDGGGSHGRSIPHPATILSILENCFDSIFITLNMTCTNPQIKMQKSDQKPNQEDHLLLLLVVRDPGPSGHGGSWQLKSGSPIHLLLLPKVCWSNRTSCFDRCWGRTEQKLGLKSNSDLQIELTCICQRLTTYFHF